ncbi:calcyclin-binding protein-like [Hylaeus volcanicus]|uniref:calcyclin-binding protein-like n=1 Tax=Hylaeus volcanicus TaxID=313075 RepID=UPI0023B8758A|nr:calcyclin-binding protein-like [Hylaeus volcanicus]
MSNISQQINDYQSEIDDWLHLKSCTKNTNILKAIDDKITGLRRLIENSAPQKRMDDHEDENAVKSKISKKVTDLYTPISNFAWDQTQNVVKIYVTIAQLKELNSNMVKVQFTNNSMSLTVTSHDRSCPSQRLNISKFFKPILPDKCKYRLRDNMITITLTKLEPTSWDDVKYKEPQKPSKLGNDMGESTGDPGQSLMKLMKNLYEEGDDQMKRTIAKAWTESQSKQGGMNNFGLP